jgi:hypothetical protein
MTRRFEHDPLGETSCPGCRLPVFFAWNDDMVSTCLEPDDDGALAVSVDLNHIPWVRPVAAGRQLELGERLYRLHEPGCPAAPAPVTDLTARRRARRRPPLPERRAAHAR